MWEIQIQNLRWTYYLNIFLTFLASKAWPRNPLKKKKKSVDVGKSWCQFWESHWQNYLVIRSTSTFSMSSAVLHFLGCQRRPCKVSNGLHWGWLRREESMWKGQEILVWKKQSRAPERGWEARWGGKVVSSLGRGNPVCSWKAGWQVL